MNKPLLPCPFCGGEVSIALCGNGFDAWWFITRGHGENACKCKLFMESKKFNKDSEMANFVADDLIATWDRRANHIRDTTKMVSNADRIRKTTDEELARWLVDATVCERVCNEDEYCHGNECVKRVTDWLKQPAKEEHHEAD